MFEDGRVLLAKCVLRILVIFMYRPFIVVILSVFG